MKKIMIAAAVLAAPAPALAGVDCSLLLKDPTTAKYYDGCVARHPPRQAGSGWRDALAGMGGYIAAQSRPAPSPGVYEGEYTQGHNKVCMYNDAGSARAETVGAADICSR